MRLHRHDLDFVLRRPPTLMMILALVKKPVGQKKYGETGGGI
jgi:hypothetical protein